MNGTVTGAGTAPPAAATDAAAPNQQAWNDAKAATPNSKAASAAQAQQSQMEASMIMEIGQLAMGPLIQKMNNGGQDDD